MTNTLNVGLRYPSCVRIRLPFVLLALSLVCVHAPVRAAPINGSYDIMVGESARLLQGQLRYSRGEITGGQLYAMEHDEMCKSPSARMLDRNRPAIKLQNTSAMENDLSSFSIDLTELGFEFGDGDLPGDGFGGLLVMKSNRSDPGVDFSASYGTDRTKLTINFTGLTQGRAAIFRIDLDPVPVTGPLYPDYRGILVGGDVGNGPTNPGLISATFSAGGMEATTPTVPFAPSMGGTIAGGLESYSNQSESQMFGQSGGTEIPEPSTMVLLAAGVTGLMAFRRRKAK